MENKEESSTFTTPYLKLKKAGKESARWREAQIIKKNNEKKKEKLKRRSRR